MKKRKLVIYNNKVSKIISHYEDKIIIEYYDEEIKENDYYMSLEIKPKNYGK